MKLIIKLILSKIDEKSLIRLLGLLEFGFHDFCYKKSLQALSEQRVDLSKKLLYQSHQEEAHAKMLWSLADGRNRPQRADDNKLCGGVALDNPDYFIEGNPTWISERDGKIKQWQNTSGISVRYAIARSFFANQKAEDYNWSDALAFMCVGEKLGQEFYSALGHELDEVILKKIANDENAHANYLWETLREEVGVLAYWFICKWHLRKFLSLAFIPYDLYQISQRKKTRS